MRAPKVTFLRASLFVLAMAVAALALDLWVGCDPTPPAEPTGCTEPGVAVGEGWIDCDTQQELRTARRATVYRQQMRQHAGVWDISDAWLDKFARDVCEALKTWAKGDGQYLAGVLVDQWGSDPDLALYAVETAAHYQCPEHAEITWSPR